eukprot:489000-Ditylum_brightwellii.AAC.1
MVGRKRAGRRAEIQGGKLSGAVQPKSEVFQYLGSSSQLGRRAWQLFNVLPAFQCSSVLKNVSS